MNNERILALADLIEQQPHTTPGAPSGFSMASYQHHCGTPACLAGWTVHTFCDGLDGLDNGLIRALARDRLGLSDGVADDLFIYTDGLPLDAITPPHAAFTLRHLADSGEVDWLAYGKASALKEPSL